jgi:hypothetical protein
MCDANPIEECFKELIEKEILTIEDATTSDTITAVKFPPISAKLRFLLHNTLQEHPAFQTVSVGIEPCRHPIIFKPITAVKIVDVPESKTFENHDMEFRFRTGLLDKLCLVAPTNDFGIFVNAVEKLDQDFSDSYPFVTVSWDMKYIEIRRALRAYYRKYLVNCYEVRESDDKSYHILISDSRETTVDIIKLYKEELNLLSLQEVSGKVCNVLHVMAKCDKLKPVKPRATVDRSAAANIMWRHLGLAKKPRTNAADSRTK